MPKSPLGEGNTLKSSHGFRKVVFITPSLPHNIPHSSLADGRFSRLYALPGTPHVLHRRIALIIPPLLLL